MRIDSCRICGNTELLPVLDLGDQALTGVFPKTREQVVPSVPLVLVKCSPSGCGLVQLLDTAEFSLMYNEDYGYRSGIHKFMIDHLSGKVAQLRDLAQPQPGDLVLDIGSNDSTLLRAYPEGLRRVGIDPTGAKFRHLYPEDAELVVDYFSREAFAARTGGARAKIVTSIAMFYDLPDPLRFMQDVHDVLDDEGVWMMEQSYLPSMLEANAYDVVCHEHLEYYALRQIEWMAERAGLRVIRAQITPVYGGSLCAVLARKGSSYVADEAAIAAIRAREDEAGLHTMAPFDAFGKRVEEQKGLLLDFLQRSRDTGRLTLGYGASTKGNVILQYCGLGPADLPAIGEVNPEKKGCFTPGTKIPIVSEPDARSRRPDHLLVLPWIYRDGFMEREAAYRAAGGKLVFPLPEFEIV